MKPASLIVLVLALAGWGFMSSDVKLDSYSVGIEGNQPVVKWVSAVEDDLDHYEIHRKTRFSDWESIAAVDPRGSGTSYSYRDEQVYKYAGETVEYELFSVSTTGVRTSFGALTVSYTPTAVRRTWGSIKAMFQ